MSFLARFSIRTRIAAGLGLILLLAVISAGQALWQNKVIKLRCWKKMTKLVVVAENGKQKALPLIWVQVGIGCPKCSKIFSRILVTKFLIFTNC